MISGLAFCCESSIILCICFKPEKKGWFILHLSLALLPPLSFPLLPPCLLFYFILYLIVVYISIINLFLVQPQIFLLLHFWFSASSSCRGKWMKGCAVLSCWLGLHRVILKMFSLFSYSAKLCCLPCFQPFREPGIWDRTRLVGKIFKFL